MKKNETEVDEKVVNQIVKLLREYNPELSEAMAEANVRALLCVGH